jgi:hypothetical protein
MFINFEKFNESIKLSQAKKYTQIWKDANMANYMAKEFDNKYRIYLPIDISSVNIEPDENIKDKVDEFLYKNGYEIESYNANLCIKIGTDKNFTKITKILQKFENSKLLIAYNKDYEQLTKKSNGYFVVISRHPVDIAGMTTGRRWLSCMDIESGGNRHYVEYDIKEGSIIAYLIKNDDKNIQNPLSRILIKPYIYQKTGKTYLMPGYTYGIISEKFEETINDWLISVQGELPTGRFSINQNLYGDGQISKLHISKEINFFIDKCCENVKSIEYEEISKTIEIICDYFELCANIGDFTIKKIYALECNIDCNFLKETVFGHNSVEVNKLRIDNFDSDIHNEILLNSIKPHQYSFDFVTIETLKMINKLSFMENYKIGELVISGPVKGIENDLRNVKMKNLIIYSYGFESINSSFFGFKSLYTLDTIKIRYVDDVYFDLSKLKSSNYVIEGCPNLQMNISKKMNKLHDELHIKTSNIKNVDEFLKQFDGISRYIPFVKFDNCKLEGEEFDFVEIIKK